MPFSFLPRMIYPHLTDVRAEELTARGVSFLMLDFDNTIVPYTTSEPTAEMTAWLKTMQASGIGLCWSAVRCSVRAARSRAVRSTRTCWAQTARACSRF